MEKRKYKCRSVEVVKLDRAALHAIAEKYSYNKASRLLNCHSDYLRKYVKEHFSDLHELFVQSGITNRQTLNKGIDKR